MSIQSNSKPSESNTPLPVRTPSRAAALLAKIRNLFSRRAEIAQKIDEPVGDQVYLPKEILDLIASLAPPGKGGRS